MRTSVFLLLVSLSLSVLCVVYGIPRRPSPDQAHAVPDTRETEVTVYDEDGVNMGVRSFFLERFDGGAVGSVEEGYDLYEVEDGAGALRFIRPHQEAFPVVRPSGSRYLIVAFVEQRTARDVYLLDMKERRVRHYAYVEQFIVMSVDRQEVVLCDQRSGRIMVRDFLGKESRSLPFTGRRTCDVGLGAISPDGRKVAFLADETGTEAPKYDAYIYRFEEDSVAKISANVRYGNALRWKDDTAFFTVFENHLGNGVMQRVPQQEITVD
jgi:hypothetical protein